MFFYKCPRCTERTYDKLSTHSYCAHCNYSPDFDQIIMCDDLPIPPWVWEELKGSDNKEKPQQTEKIAA